MAQRKDLTGQRFGRFVVLERIIPGKCGLDGRSRSKYKCQCDCGNIREIQGNCLTTGNSQSCGCKRADNLREQKQLRPFEWLFNLLKASSSRRGFPFSLIYEDFLIFTEEKECNYCGSPVNWCAYSQNRNTRGYGYNLDRKDSSMGYSLDNVVVCCGVCNQAKNDLTVEEFKNWITSVSQRLESGRWPEQAYYTVQE